MKQKKLFAFVLSAVMTVSALIPSIPVSANTETDAPDTSVSMGDMSVTATNSFGAMLADELTAAQRDQLQGNGNTVFSVEMEGNLANVSFQTVRYCTLIVGIYDDSGETLLASGRTAVTPEDREMQIEIEFGEIPQYFYVRAYLVDSDSLAPLSTVYCCPNYTEKMQEFFAKTVDDFDADLVLNFDDDSANNFAVFKEGTVMLNPEEGYDTVISADDANDVYVIENADDTVLSLQAGDVLSYQYSENDLMIVKVASTETDGSTVTIHGGETNMQEIFEYVRIEAAQGMQDADVQPAEGVELVHTTEDTARVRSRSKIETGVSATEELKKKFVDEKFPKEEPSDSGFNYQVKINGEVSLSVSAEVKYYYSVLFLEAYLELSLKYSAKAQITASGKVSFTLPLATEIGFEPIPGVFVGISPALVIELSGKIEVTAEFSGSVGIRADTEADDKIQNISESPKAEFSVKAEATLSVCFDLRPRVIVLCDEIAKFEASAKVGVEVTAKLEKEIDFIHYASDRENQAMLHDCRNCLEGELHGVFDLSFKIELALLDELEFKLLEYKPKICDFYFSFDHKEFGLGECPYDLHRAVIQVFSYDGNPLSDAEITFHAHGNVKQFTSLLKPAERVTGPLKTDAEGKIEVFLPQEYVSYTVTADGYAENEQHIIVTDYPEDAFIAAEVTMYPPTYPVTVRVQDESGSPLAKVGLSYGQAKDDSVSTGQDGCAVIRLYKGDYHLCANKTGYKQATSNGVMTDPDAEITLTMKLKSTEDILLEQVPTASGICGASGDNLKWAYYDESGILLITGIGKMKTFDSINPPPWELYKRGIVQVLISNGTTSIGQLAFGNCQRMENVTIPDTVSEIGPNAFANCTSLKSLKIPEGVETLDMVFAFCRSLASVQIPSTAHFFDRGSLSGLRGLKEIVLSEENPYYRLEDGVLYNADMTEMLLYPPLKEGAKYTVPDGVNSIAGAFAYNQNLVSVQLPEGVTDISGAFQECVNLKNVNVPDSVTEMNNAFSKCSSLQACSIPDGITALSGVFNECTALASVVIPDSVTVIGNSAFAKCAGLTEIAIPDGVTVIGSSAFAECAGLTEITIPENVTEIGDRAFEGCKGLTAFAFPHGVTAVEDQVLSGCKALESVSIPEGVTSIGSRAFANCKSLPEVTLPSTVTELKDAFKSCSVLQSVNLPEGVAVLNSYTFYGCWALTAISIPKTVTEIESGVFASSGLKDIYYPGTEEEWNAISIGDNIEILSAEKHFGSAQPAQAKPAGLPTAEAAESVQAEHDAVIRSLPETEPDSADQTDSVSTAALDGLFADTVYNFYVLLSKNTDDPLHPVNLLYLTQFVSDADGTAEIRYALPFDAENAVILSVPAEKTVTDAIIRIPDLIFTGSTVSPQITVQVNGVTLTENRDYQLSGDLTADDVGTYFVKVTGIGDYIGSRTAYYAVICEHEDADGVCKVCGAIADEAWLSGDVNTDSRVSLADAVFLARIIGEDSMPPLSEENLTRADMNGDGMITVLDLRQMLRMLAGIV